MQLINLFLIRGIAQLVEQRSPKPRAEGSSPSAPASEKCVKPAWLQGLAHFLFFRLAFFAPENEAFSDRS